MPTTVQTRNISVDVFSSLLRGWISITEEHNRTGLLTPCVKSSTVLMLSFCYRSANVSLSISVRTKRLHRMIRSDILRFFETLSHHDSIRFLFPSNISKFHFLSCTSEVQYFVIRTIDDHFTSKITY
jgi:hypothetical protein